METRDFKLDQKRLKKWARQQPFPGSFYVEMAKEVEATLSSPEATQEVDKSKSLFSDSNGSESSGWYSSNKLDQSTALFSAVAIPETLPSSTPIEPEVVANVSDLQSFKAEIKSLVQQLEEKISNVKNGDWLPNCEVFQNLHTNVAVLDKV